MIYLNELCFLNTLNNGKWLKTDLRENLVALGKTSVHVLLLSRQGHDVVGLEQPSGGVHELQRVVVWRRDDAPLKRTKAKGTKGKARVQSFESCPGLGSGGYYIDTNTYDTFSERLHTSDRS